ncbi:MAG: Lrp/AsnC family transcriptional regulator [Geminicoccaceae bacterium]|nr:Lrp/AsnC family transcriptional regulator [Geminicoccaceae bacterium]
MTTLSPTARHLIDGFQRGLPLRPRPYAEMADRLGVDEETVLALLARLQAEGVVSRVGAVVEPHAAGWSTLAAMSVPPWALAQIADFVSAYPEVNHNYEREHRLNLWFVVTAPTPEAVRRVLDGIEYRVGVPVLDLPLEEAFRLDLGFALQWH